MKNKIKKITQKQMCHWIGRLGYEILDKIVGPEIGADNIIADLYLVDIMTYANDKKQGRKIVKKIIKKYKPDDENGLWSEEMLNWPIVLIVTFIIEGGKYKL